MQIIYGILSWQRLPDGIAEMMAALKNYPWSDGNVCSLSSARSRCSLAVNVSGTESIRQPLTDGELTIAADVRLDNRQSLLSTFGITPDDGMVLSDAQLLLLAFKKWGVDCARQLLGDFAFSIWDASNERLFCCRDHSGARPFYYVHQQGKQFLFASDLLALLAHPDVQQVLNLPYLKALLLTRGGQFPHLSYTFYQNAHKLPPATFLTVDRDGLQLHRYWYPAQTSERCYNNESDYVEELRLLLQEAVECRLRGVQKAGAHLSGGLDSSSLAVLAHRTMRKRGESLTGFSWAPPFTLQPAVPEDERERIDALCQLEHIPLCYTTLTADHLLNHLQRDITRQPTLTLQWELSSSREAASRGISTMLSGWGGDELLAFNGRGYFADLFRLGRWITLHRELTMQQRRLGGIVWKNWIRQGIFPLLPNKVLQFLRPDWYPPVPSLPHFLKPDFVMALADVEPLYKNLFLEKPGVRNTQIALLENGHISYRMESWAAHGATLGMGYVYPLLDKRLVDFALSIPDYLFFKDGWMRYLYRTAMAGILPDRLRWSKTKFEPARFEKHVFTLTSVKESVRALLLTRADNPWVDIYRLLETMDQIDTHAPEDRPLLIRKNAIGRGINLAFVNPGATIDY